MLANAKALIAKTWKNEVADLEPGRHEVNETLLVRVRGHVERHKDQSVGATLSIPFITVVAFLLERVDVEREHGVSLLAQSKTDPGRHEPLIDQVTWDKIRVSYDEQNYRSHELVYASRLIKCGHCGHVVTGEEKFKETKKGLKSYIYYRCSRYRTAGHPRVRLPERELDRQLQEMFDSVGNLSNENRNLIQIVARSILETRFEDEKVHVSESKRLLSLLETQRKKLLSRNLSGSISDDLFDQQQAEYNDQERRLKSQMARQGQIGQRIESVCGQAGRVFDLLSDDWLTMERRARQLALSALFGGFRLEGRILVPENRTPLKLFRAG